MMKFVDLKKHRKFFILTIILCTFIFSFFVLESIYIQGKSYTVILGNELFIATVPEQQGKNRDINSGDKANEVLLEYKKSTFEFADSGETIVTEMWMDPETLENRVDEIVITGEGKVAKNYSLFTKDGAKHHINFIRDESGKATSGEEFYYPQEVADTNADSLRKYETFAGRKAMYQDSAFWEDKSAVTFDGKTLKKLLCGNEEEGKTTTVYIDESTGLPVKEEAFVNGKLFSTITYEFKHVENDKNLFDVSEEGVEVEAKDLSQTLRPMRLREEQNSN